MADRPGGFKFFPGINQNTLYEQAVEIRDYVVKEVLERRMGKVMVAYPKPVSFTAQTIEVVNLLPCGELFDRRAQSEVSERWHGRGILADARKVVVESAFPEMVAYLASVWVTSRLFEVFEDSKLAEFSARAMHLEGSQQKVERNLKSVRHRFFKATHEQIDKGMRESFAASRSGRRRKKREAQAA
jgi:F0F1-type ATP synthase gamma subunit